MEKSYTPYYHAFPPKSIVKKKSNNNNQSSKTITNTSAKDPITTSPTTLLLSSTTNILHPTETYNALPDCVQEKLNTTCDALLLAFQEIGTTDNDWKILVQEETNQYICKRKILTNCPTQTYLKMQVFCPYSMYDIALFIMNPESPPKFLKNSVESVTIPIAFSQHTCIQYMTFRSKFVFSARDAVYIGHWRMLSDGSVLICFVSDDYYDIVPMQENIVRTEMILGGYWLQPCENGTTLSYLSHVSTYLPIY